MQLVKAFLSHLLSSSIQPNKKNDLPNPSRKHGYPYPEVHGWRYDIRSCSQTKHTQSIILSCIFWVYVLEENPKFFNKAHA